MRKRCIYSASYVLMIAAMLVLIISSMMIKLEDWVVRTAGIILLVDLVVLTYLSVRKANKGLS